MHERELHRQDGQEKRGCWVLCESLGHSAKISFDLLAPLLGTKVCLGKRTSIFTFRRVAICQHCAFCQHCEFCQRHQNSCQDLMARELLGRLIYVLCSERGIWKYDFKWLISVITGLRKVTDIIMYPLHVDYPSLASTHLHFPSFPKVVWHLIATAHFLMICLTALTRSSCKSFQSFFLFTSLWYMRVNSCRFPGGFAGKIACSVSRRRTCYSKTHRVSYWAHVFAHPRRVVLDSCRIGRRVLSVGPIRSDSLGLDRTGIRMAGERTFASPMWSPPRPNWRGILLHGLPRRWRGLPEQCFWSACAYREFWRFGEIQRVLLNGECQSNEHFEW